MLGVCASLTLSSIWTSETFMRTRGAGSDTPLMVPFPPAALNHHIHAVKTASIGTLGRSRPPMPVVVPSAPEVQETTRMLEDSESVSSRVGPECGAGSLSPQASTHLLP